MFCKPLLYRIIFNVMLHVAALCVFLGKGFSLKAIHESFLLNCFHHLSMYRSNGMEDE